MQSWLPSIFNSPPDDHSNDQNSAPNSPNFTGVKDDLSTIFRGVVSFLAPPPEAAAAPAEEGSSSVTISGIKNDLAEIQGTFKSGLSLLSSKFTTNLLSFQNQVKGNDDIDEVGEEEDEGVVGITEEVVGFVQKIAQRPELWTDFPISLPDDYDMSDYQIEHAAEIEDLVPGLVSLRQRICSQMSNGKFWMIYFILLIPRLSEEDLELLSSPKVLEMREMLMQKLQNKNNAAKETSAKFENVDISEEGQSKERKETPSKHEDVQAENVTEESQSNERNETPLKHEDVQVKTINEENQGKAKKETPSKHEDMQAEPLNVTRDAESVSNEECIKSGVHNSSTSRDGAKQSENEDDVSFSDLEDDDNDLSDKVSGFRSRKVSSTQWVKLKDNSDVSQGSQQKQAATESEDESSDWLTVDDSYL